MRPFRIFEGSNDVLCDAIAQAAEKAAKTGGESFAATLPQGLRCLSGHILANATALQWCADAGLSRPALQPLIARITRDLLFAEIGQADAGLVEY